MHGYFSGFDYSFSNRLVFMASVNDTAVSDGKGGGIDWMDFRKDSRGQMRKAK
jgi:hypothetical protein